MLCNAYWRAAAQQGARMVPRSAVEEVMVKDGKVAGIADLKRRGPASTTTASSRGETRCSSQ